MKYPWAKTATSRWVRVACRSWIAAFDWAERNGGAQSHASWLHVEEGSLIGINAVVLNGAKIGAVA